MADHGTGHRATVPQMSQNPWLVERIYHPHISPKNELVTNTVCCNLSKMFATWDLGHIMEGEAGLKKNTTVHCD